MATANQRSVEVDFFRGLVLLVIVLDHISGSVLSHVMLHAYAYCDAAEVFVFLGGYATAAAYCTLAARGEPGAAARRFFKRAWEIYRAYLLTALLMLVAGLIIMLSGVHTPILAYTGLPDLQSKPLTTVFNIVSLRNQPYLASVLPMYACFALAAPFAIPLAQRRPLVALSAGVLVWMFAPPLAHMLPSADPQGWGFNPFAWQLMFMLGILCRLHPLTHAFQQSMSGKRLTRLAWTIAIACAVIKLVLESQPEAGHYKQNLAGFRIISFLALAWLAAQAVRLGWVARIARAWPQVVTVGRHGLTCFVSGTLISITADTALRALAAPPGRAAFAAGLAADFSAIAAMLLVAGLMQYRQRRMPLPATLPTGLARAAASPHRVG